MKYGKGLFILILAIFIISASCVCASDADDVQTASQDGSQTQLTHNNEVTVEEHDLQKTDGDILAGATKSFSHLNSKINDNNDSFIELQDDYAYDNDTDFAFLEGIEINHELTIDGNGHTINGSGMAAGFYTSQNVVLKNIRFTHFGNYNTTTSFTNYYSQAVRACRNADYVYADVRVVNCTFDCCQAGEGGAVCRVTAINSTFRNCSSLSGGASYESDAYNCRFIGNRAEYTGGAMAYGNAFDCYFEGNVAEADGGPTAEGGGAALYVSCYNCTFVGNSARCGGACFSDYLYVEIVNSTFKSNSASDEGGAIYLIGSSYLVVGCAFEHNSAVNRGGAIFDGFGSTTTVFCTYNDNTASLDPDTCGCHSVLPEFAVAGEPLAVNYPNVAIPINIVCSHEIYSSPSLYYFNGTEVTIKVYNKTSLILTDSALSGSLWNNTLDFGTYTVQLSAILYGTPISKTFTYTINRTPTAITLSSPTLDVSSSVFHVVQENETYLTVTLTDEAGNPLQGHDIKLTRENHYTKSYRTNQSGQAVIALHTFELPEYCGSSYYLTLQFETIGVYETSQPVGFYLNVRKPGDKAPKSFCDLNATVNGNQDSVIVLDDDYSYNPDTDSEFIMGIPVNRTVTIDGNGHTIDGCGNLAKGFEANNFEISFKNIKFVNLGKATSSDYDGGAIHTRNSATEVKDCEFNGCQGYFGGAVYGATVVNCTFKNCNAISGGAIYMGNAINSTFIGNKAQSGGAIHGGESSSGKARTCVIACHFENNTATDSSGAVYDCDVVLCTFKNNSPSANYNAHFPAVSMETSTVTGNCPSVLLPLDLYYYDESGVLSDYCTDSKYYFSNIELDLAVSGNGQTIGTYQALSASSYEFNLARGNYTVSISFTHPYDNEISSNECTLTVNGYATSINADNLEIEYGETGNLTAALIMSNSTTPLANKTLTVNFNGNAINPITDGNGQISISVPKLSVGTYPADIDFAGDDDYEPCQKTVDVIVFKGITNLVSENVTVSYGEGRITAKLTDKKGNPLADCDVSLDLIEKTSKTNQSGEVAFDLSGLAAGTYDAGISFSGNALYNQSAANVRITVNRINSTLEILNDIIFDYGDEGSAEVSSAGADGFDAVVLGHSEAIIVVSGNTVTVSGLDAGNYTLQVIAKGDANHNDVTKTACITVRKVDSTLTLKDIVFDYGGEGSASVSFDSTSGIDAFVVDHPEAVVNVDGNVITVSGLNAGSYTLKVTTNPDSNHNAVTKTADITVNKLDSTLTVANIAFKYGASGSASVSFTGATGFTASVTDQPGAAVHVDGNTITVSGLNAGSYTLAVTTVTDENHNPVTKNAKITVSKVYSTLTLKNAAFDYGKTGYALVSFTGATGITAKVINQPDAVINVKGDAVEVSNLDAGKYTLAVTTVPDGNHNGITNTATITVNKVDSTLTVSAITFDYGTSGSSEVEFSGATGIVASVNDANAVVEVNGNIITVSNLNVGRYVLTVTTVPDTNHNAVTKTADVIVNKVDSAVDDNNNGSSSGNGSAVDGGNNGSSDVDNNGSSSGNGSVVDGGNNGSSDVNNNGSSSGNGSVVDGDNNGSDSDNGTSSGNGSSDVNNGGSSSGNGSDSDNGSSDVNNGGSSSGNGSSDVNNNNSTVDGDNGGSSSGNGSSDVDKNNTAVDGNKTDAPGDVNENATAIEVRDDTFSYNEDGSLNIKLDGLDGAEVGIVGHPEAKINVKDGKITVSGLDEGNYTLKVTTAADGNQAQEIKMLHFSINKVAAPVDVGEIKVNYGQAANVTVPVDGSARVTAEIDGKTVEVRGNVISIPQLGVGKHTITIAVTTNASKYPVVRTFDFEVKKANATVKATSSVIYNSGKDITMTFRDENGNPISNATVTVNLKGAKDYVTDESGQIRVSSKGLAPKTYTAKIQFRGTDNYNGFTTTAKVTVKKATPKITAKAKTFKITTKTKKYTVTLKANGKVMKKKTVYLKVKGKTYKAKTNSKGKATFKITKLNKKGTFKATVTFKANKYYKKATKKVKLTVKSASKKSKR